MADGYGILALLYAFGLALLLAEVFIPSHGLLTAGSIVILAIAVVKTFGHNTTAGIVAAVSCGVLVPTVLLMMIKNIHRLPMGKYIAPPNPKAPREEDLYPAEQLRALVGKSGRSVTPLRPVGTCEFDGQRVQCIAELGLIEKDTSVRACSLSGKDLVVTIDREQESSSV